MEKKEKNCLKCAHFYVTWDRARPRGCHALEFKAAAMPSVEVLQATGAPCALFVLKKGLK